MKNIQNDTPSKKRQHGFTLIEVVIALVLSGIIMGAILPRLLGSADSGEVGAAIMQLTTSFPQAITNIRGRRRTCVGLVIADLASNGASSKTQWNQDYAVAVNAAGNTVTITYPTTGASDPDEAGADVVLNITNLNAAGITAAYASPDLTVTYPCR
ncbi:MAG: type II secretion system protein [Pseudomonadales bacterium]